MLAGCCHHSCLTLIASSKGRVILADPIPLNRTLRKMADLTIRLMQGNELSGWFSFQFWENVCTDS